MKAWLQIVVSQTSYDEWGAVVVADHRDAVDARIWKQLWCEAVAIQGQGQSWKSGHFHEPSSPPFTMEAGN